MFRRRQRSARRARSAYRSPFLYGRKPLFELLEDRRVLAVFTVDTTADNTDAGGTLTLREAIIAANAAGTDDVIQFAAALNGDTIFIDHDALGPLPTITDDVEITAAALSMGITVDGNDPSATDGDGVRIFEIDDGTGSEIEVSINHLTLTGGDVTGSGGAIFSYENLTIINSTITGNHATGDGGGIHSGYGDLDISGSTISDNTAGNDGGGINSYYSYTKINASTISGNMAEGDGGGIYIYNDDLNLDNSTVSGNHADEDGGGIYLYDSSSSTISNSIISGNTADDDGGGVRAYESNLDINLSTISGNDAAGDGGGVYARYGDTNIFDSTISGNEAAGNGGGIYARSSSTSTIDSTISGNSSDADGGGIYAYYGTTSISNSTISGNTAIDDGGGIYAYLLSDDTLTIRYSTITLNISDFNSSGFGSGGGMYLSGDGGSVTIENTIIAENIDNTDTAPDIDNESASDNPSLNIDYSLVGMNEGSGLAPGDPTGNLIGTAALPIDPLLGGLMDNGGPTFTHALLVGSPAIDTGNPGFTTPPDYDQRGNPFVRVVDGDEDGSAYLDMGAFEFAPPPFPTILGSEPTIIRHVKNVDPGEIDTYKYTAHSTGKLITRIYFDHTDGDLDLQILDENNNVIATSSTSSETQDFEEIIMPVVTQEMYFIRVLTIHIPGEFQTTEYDLEVENFPTPVPSGVHLDPLSDTGMMNNDGVTMDKTPRLFIQTDVLNFVDTNNNGIVDDPIHVLTAAEATAGLTAGIAVELTLVNTTTSTSVTVFADPLIVASPEVYVFTPTVDLAAGTYLVSARTKIFDLREDELEMPDPAMARSNASPPLWFTIDCEAPLNSTFGLLESSDSGMFDDDHVTNKMQPAFSGLAEPNSKVNVFAQRTNPTTGAPIGVPLLVGSGVVGSEGTNTGMIDHLVLGLWEVTVEPLVDGKYNFFARFEDTAGNVSDPVALSESKTNDTDVPIPNPGTMTSTIDFAAADFPLVGNATMTNLPVVDVNVTINITHTFDGDLDIVLISPTGTRIDLSLDNGGGGDNFTNTIFDDAAGTSITAGAAPFTGRFRPQEALRGLFNENLIGTWTLEITDDTPGDVGTLLDWSLEVVTPQMVVIDTNAPNTPFLDLVSASDSGGSNQDNITKDNTPTVTMTSSDLNVNLSKLLWTDNFKFRIYDRFENTAEFLLYDSALDVAVDAIDFAGDMFTALTLITETLPEQFFALFGTNAAVLAGGVLADGRHNLKLEVEDRAGNISPDFILDITIDTQAPDVTFGEALVDIDGLAADSDSGVVTMPETFADRITSDTTPRLWGQAEPGSSVRVFYDSDADGVIDLGTDIFLGQTQAVPIGFGGVFPAGYWELVTVRDLNQILGVPIDGLRRLLVTAEDVAGNPMPMDGVLPAGDALEIFIDTQGPQITNAFVTGYDDFDLFDPKPSENGYTPLVDSLTIAVRDLPSRVDQAIDINDFLYEALVEGIAEAPGNYLLVGDHVGPIAIESITVLNESAADYTFNGTMSGIPTSTVIPAAGLVGALEQPIVGDYILIDTGAAAGQVRRIVAYDPNTGTMTLDQPLLNVPVSGDLFTITTFAEAQIVLEFAAPLPDDRYTLTVSDALVDPAGNHLDGESNADAPLGAPQFPSGDGVPGGNFVARFTVDSRPEIGAYVAKDIDIDINGNFVWDPAASQIGGDIHDVDLSFTLPVANSNGTVGLGGYGVHDLLFAGKFRPFHGNGEGNGDAAAALNGNGNPRYFDQLAAFGFSGELGFFRWIIDTNSDGVVTDGTDIITFQSALTNFDVAGAIPVAGNFDGNLSNGDEIGLYNHGTWALDTNHNFVIGGGDTFLFGNMLGHPIVGDFDGDGADDFAVFNNNVFTFDLNQNGFADQVLVLGFPGVLDHPVAADMDQDGIDDIGLWVPRTSGSPPRTVAEWYFWISDDYHGYNRDFGTINTLDHAFTVVPFGNDIFAEFGDERALPIVGNFDPPVASAGSATQQTAAKSSPAQSKSTASSSTSSSSAQSNSTQTSAKQSTSTAPVTTSSAPKSAPASTTAAKTTTSSTPSASTTQAASQSAATTSSTTVAPQPKPVVQNNPPAASNTTTSKSATTQSSSSSAANPPVAPVAPQTASESVLPSVLPSKGSIDLKAAIAAYQNPGKSAPVAAAKPAAKSVVESTPAPAAKAAPVSTPAPKPVVAPVVAPVVVEAPKPTVAAATPQVNLTSKAPVDLKAAIAAYQNPVAAKPAPVAAAPVAKATFTTSVVAPVLAVAPPIVVPSAAAFVSTAVVKAPIAVSSAVVAKVPTFVGSEAPLLAVSAPVELASMTFSVVSSSLPVLEGLTAPVFGSTTQVGSSVDQGLSLLNGQLSFSAWNFQEAIGEVDLWAADEEVLEDLTLDSVDGAAESSVAVAWQEWDA